jgi:hypothetical protein
MGKDCKTKSLHQENKQRRRRKRAKRGDEGGMPATLQRFAKPF